MEKIRIVLAEDHAIVRQGLYTLLDRTTGFEVVGQTGVGAEVLALVHEHLPNVVVLDWALADQKAGEVIETLKAAFPQIAVVILSMHKDDAYVIEAVRAGATGYVLKESSVSELLEAIRTVVVGKTFFSKKLPPALIAQIRSQDVEHAASRYDLLSRREREVLAWVGAGKSSQEIADLLNISSRTVEAHRANLLAKLGLSTPAALIHYALRRQAKGGFSEGDDI